jgi:hypothetical protein
MKDKPPPDRRTFADEWDEIGYLHNKLLYWLYQRADPKKARLYAPRLERLLLKAAPDHDAILGEECWSLIHEAKDELESAIESRKNEIRLIRRLYELSRGAPHEDVALKNYGNDDLSDRLDLLVVLYHDSGDLDKAIGILQKSKKLCRAYDIAFDAGEILQDYIKEKKNSRQAAAS